MRLTEHFWLREFRAPVTDIAALKCFALASMIESCWRGLAGQITITSGYRSAQDNERVGGAPKSDHLFGGIGAAVDFVGENWDNNIKLDGLSRLFSTSDMWGQCIFYRDHPHIHLSLAGTHNRQMFFYSNKIYHHILTVDELKIKLEAIK